MHHPPHPVAIQQPTDDDAKQIGRNGVAGNFQQTIRSNRISASSSSIAHLVEQTRGIAAVLEFLRQRRQHIRHIKLGLSGQ